MAGLWLGDVWVVCGPVVVGDLDAFCMISLCLAAVWKCFVVELGFGDFKGCVLWFSFFAGGLMILGDLAVGSWFNGVEKFSCGKIV